MTGPARFRKPRLLTGKNLRFRNADLKDAPFILGLRSDPAKNEHLSRTSGDLADQEAWMRQYETDDSQVYFVIEDRNGRPVGTVRLYDQRDDSFSWGSWILTDDAPKSAAVESTVMVYSFALELGFSEAHFEVRKKNDKVWAYHERLGASRTSSDEQNYYYRMSRHAIESALRHYATRVPDGVKVDWGG